MAHKKNAVSKRLAKSIERVKGVANLRNLVRWTGPDPLGTTREDSVLRKAFERYSLDPRDPLAGRILLVELASVLFDKADGGRPPKWNQGRRWLQFKIDVTQIEDEHFRKTGKYPTKTKVADRLLERFPERYQCDNKTALLRYLFTPPTAVKKKLLPKT
jgi:hypothetical protein